MRVGFKQELGFKWWVGLWQAEVQRGKHSQQRTNNVGGVYAWMCVSFHSIAALDLLVAKGLRLIWAWLKDRHFILKIQTGCKISGINWDWVSEHCKAYCSPPYFCFCMSASLYVLLKTSFPCFLSPWFSKSLGWISLSLKDWLTWG